MKCPYAADRKIMTTQNILYDDEGNQIGMTEIITNNASFTECLKEECGAYKDSECHYRG